MASPNGKLIYVAEYNHNVVGLVDTVRNENIEDFEASRNRLAKTHAVWITGDRQGPLRDQRGRDADGAKARSRSSTPRTGRLAWEIPDRHPPE